MGLYQTLFKAGNLSGFEKQFNSSFRKDFGALIDGWLGRQIKKSCGSLIYARKRQMCRQLDKLFNVFPKGIGFIKAELPFGTISKNVLGNSQQRTKL
jgi:hypothetical protein